MDSGIRLLTDFIQNELHLQLEGWSMDDSFGYAISDDGTTIVGSGTNPDGLVESFILVIPEPTTALLMLIGLAGLGRRRSSVGRHRPCMPTTRSGRLPSGLVDPNGMSGVRRKSL